MYPQVQYSLVYILLIPKAAYSGGEVLNISEKMLLPSVVESNEKSWAEMYLFI